MKQLDEVIEEIKTLMLGSVEEVVSKDKLKKRNLHEK
jgi:hypothetical protein